MGNRRIIGKAKKILPRPPPLPYSRLVPPARALSNVPSSGDERTEMVRFDHDKFLSIFASLYHCLVSQIG